MKRANSIRKKSTLLPEYDFTGGVRGRYAKQYEAGTNAVVLAPDVAEAFPNAQAVNHALRLLVKTAEQATTIRLKTKRS